MTSSLVREFLCLVIVTLVLVISPSLSFGLRETEDRSPRAVTWAKVHQTSRETFGRRQSPRSKSNVRPRDVFAKRSDKYLSSRESSNPGRTNYPKEVAVEPVGSPEPSSKFQKRALDLLYHKFIEPRIHKNIESRPSLIEELIQTFEQHVQKDLAAWSKATPHAPHTPHTSHSYAANEVEAPSPVRQTYGTPEKAAVGSNKPIEQITSVSEVLPGENEDTFVVTDESGATHVVSVDDIINSLAQMDEKEISKLLIGGTTPIEPIERRSSPARYYSEPLKPNGEEVLASKQNSIVVPVKRHISQNVESLPYVDENEVILVKSEDGDTRLVTRKDVMLATVASEKNLKPKQEPIEEIVKNINPQQSPFLTLDDIASLHGAEPVRTHESETMKRSPAIENHNDNSIYQQELAPNNGGLESIRESLAEMRRQQQKEKQVLLPSAITPTFQNAAPNSPPVQILNSPAPGGSGSFSFHNPITIHQKVNAENRPNSDSGIRDRFSNFFSRLIGKKVNKVDISQRPKVENDQYVQVVMPKPGSDVMEQITIPLPRPIHHTSRRKRSTSSVGRNVRQTGWTQSRVSPGSFRSRQGEEYTKQMDTGTADYILKSANVPEAVRTKLLAQMDKKPSFSLPGVPDVTKSVPKKPKYGPPEGKRYGVTFGSDNRRKDEFSIHYPTGYTYELPPISYANHPPEYGGGGYGYEPSGYGYQPSGYEAEPYGYELAQYHGPSPEYGGHTKQVVTHELYDEDQPLVDISLLADLKYLSKVGTQDESFSFPRVGDGSKFVDTRQKYYYR